MSHGCFISFSPLLSHNLSLLFGGLWIEVFKNFLCIIMSGGKNPIASLVVGAGQSRDQCEKEFLFTYTYGKKLLNLLLFI